MIIRFFVPGIPSTSGSKRGFVNPKTGGVIIAPTNSKKQKQWMSDVKKFGKEACGDGPLYLGPVILTIDFKLMRPKNHYGTGRNAGVLKKSAARYHLKKPDLTKLVRCTEDALKGVVWKDDSQVVRQNVGKYYSSKPGAQVIIECLEA